MLVERVSKSPARTLETGRAGSGIPDETTLEMLDGGAWRSPRREGLGDPPREEVENLASWLEILDEVAWKG